MKAKALLLSLVLLLSLGLAEDLGGESSNGALPGVIIATDANYPDAIVSGAASEYAGLSVLLTAKEALSDDIKAFLDEEKPDEVIIIGGEAVISAAIEEGLVTDGFDVTRLWGATRYGTSAEIAKYFFSEGVDEAVLVSDVLGNNEGNEDELLAVAKSLAAKDYLPVLLTGNDVLAAEVSTALTDLGVAKVYLIGKAFDANVTEELKSLNIEVELISGEDTEEVTKKVEEKVVDELIKEGVTRLLVVAPGVDFKNVIAMPAMPEKAAAKIIKDESEIPGLVAFIKEKGIKEVKVVGKPELVSKIAAQLLLTEGVRVDAMSAKDIGRKLVEHAKAMKNEWAEKREKFKEKAAERLAKNKDKLDARLAEAIEEAEAFLLDLGAQLEELEATAETEDEIAAIEEALKRYETAEAIIAKAKEAQAAGKLDLALKTLRKAHNDAKNVRWGAIKKFYAGDEDVARQKIDELLDEERAGMGRFANGIMKEFEHFKGFMEEAESAGFIADECAALIADAEGMADDVLSEFDGVDYRRARIIASKTKQKLKKCMTATRVNAKKDAAKGKLFAAAFEAKNLAEGFEDRMDMCEDRCDEEFDNCLDFIGGCEERCSGAAVECETGAEDILARCTEVGDQDLSAVVDECLSSCDFILEDTEDAEASDAEYGLCLDECGAIQEEAESSIENCEVEAEMFLEECEAKIDDCNDFCQQSSEEKCEKGVEQCVPKCLGKRFFRPGLTDNICAAKCKFTRDKKGCLDKCEDESLDEGQQHENIRKCEGEAHKVVQKCFDSCERKCANAKDVCITHERCKVTRDGDEITRDCKKVEECKPELCFARCEEGCDKAAKAYTYKCAAKRPTTKVNLGGCADECAKFKGKPLQHMQCMEKCRIKAVAKRMVPPEHMKKCKEECKGEGNKARCMTKCIAPPGLIKKAIAAGGPIFKLPLVKAKCAEECAKKLGVDLTALAGEATDKAEGAAVDCRKKCAPVVGIQKKTRCIKECAEKNREAGMGAVGTSLEMKEKARKMPACINECVKRKHEAFKKERPAPEAPAEPELEKCQADDDCANLECPMAIGMDTPMCLEGECVCGGFEDIPEGEPEGLSEEDCEDMCADIDDPEEEYICMSSCQGDDIDFIELSDDVEDIWDTAEDLIDDHLEEDFAEETEDTYTDGKDYSEEDGQTFDDFGESGCVADDDCDEGEMCFDGICEFVGSDDSDEEYVPDCVADDDCYDGEECVGGICLERGIVEDGTGSSAASCEFDEDCSEGEECVGGVCVEHGVVDDDLASSTTSCEFDEDCPEGEVCVGEVCIESAMVGGATGTSDGECEIDEDCGTDEICEDGVCVYKAPEPTPDCEIDEDCGTDEICEDGICVYKAPEPTPDCEIDEDCGTDEICEDGICVYKAPEPTPDCEVDEDCLDDEYCVDGDCVKTPEPEEDKECDEGFVYDENLAMCIPENIETGCVNDDDCMEDEYCLVVADVGVCTPNDATMPEGNCEVDEDCDVDESCMEGYCIPAF